MKIPVKVYEEVKPGMQIPTFLPLGTEVINEGGSVYLVTTI